jgi:8-oxo-dGTP diphosphatase
MIEFEKQHREPRAPADRLIFGTCPSDVVTEKCPCAYAVVFNEYNRVAVIRTPKGNTLPGGGCDLDESPSNAAIRNTLEEAGLTIEVTGQIGAVDQYMCISEEVGWVLEECTLSLARRSGTIRHPVEAGHVLGWLDPAEAMGRLHHESHAWAVERAMAIWAERRA